MIPPTIFNVKSQIEEICEQLQIAENHHSYKWFAKKGIQTQFKGNCYLLNKEGNLNHWNIICNSLLVSTGFCPLSVPYFHFQPLKDNKINFYDCELIESTEGVMVNVCFPYKDNIVVHTEEYVSSIDDNAKRILDIIKKLKFDMQDKTNTWTFRLKEDDRLYLMSGRYLKSLYELHEQDLDIVVHKWKSKDICVYRPERIMISKGLNKIYAEIEKQNHNYKSKKWIVRDNTSGERSEIDLESKEKSITTTSRDFEQVVRMWISVRGSFVILEGTYPLAKDKIKFLKDTVDTYEILISEYANKLKNCKEMQSSEIPAWMYNLAVSLTTVHKERWSRVIRTGISNLPLKQLIEIFKD